MANLAFKLQIGATVIFTVGNVFKAVEERLRKLENDRRQLRMLENIFEEHVHLREDMLRARESDSALVVALRRYLEANLGLLKQQGLELGRLTRQGRLSMSAPASSAPATSKDEKEKPGSLEVIKDVPVIGDVMKSAQALALPVTISAGYEKLIRDVMIRSGALEQNSEAGPIITEHGVSGAVLKAAKDTGMERDASAELLAQLVATGMGLGSALAYLPVAAKYVVGQGAGSEGTADIVRSLQQDAGADSVAKMERALERLTFQRKATGADPSEPLSAVQTKELKAQLSRPAAQNEPSQGILDRDLAARRDTVDQQLNETGQAIDEAARGLGEALQPATRWVVGEVGTLANQYAEMSNTGKIVTAGVGLIGSLFLLLRGKAMGAMALGKIRERFKRPAQPPPVAKPEPAKPVTPAVESATAAKPTAKPSTTAKSVANAERRRQMQKKRDKRGNARSGGRSAPRPGSAMSLSSVPSRTIAPARRGAGGAKAEAASQALDTFLNAETADEKAEGYGRAIGGLIGSVGTAFIPVVGPLLAATVGPMAGQAIGGWLGKTFFGSKAADKPAAGEKATTAQPGEVVRAMAAATPAAESLPSLASAPAPSTPPQPQQITQQFTFTPNMPISVQGSVPDVALFTQDLQAMVRRQFEELMRMATARQLADVPHVYV